MRHGLRERLRRHAGATLVDGFFRTFSSLGRLHPGADPKRHRTHVVRDVPYLPSGLPEHNLDVYVPTRGPGPFPVVLYVHGGGFRILSKDSHWIMALAFSRRGYLVFNISYRLAPRYRFPAAIEDACSAFAWVAKNAPRFGGDLSRLAVAGESAGANLAAALTVATCYERPEPFARAAFDLGLVPRATLPACGIFQVSDTERFRRRKPEMSAFVADRLTEVARAYLGRGPRAPGETDMADPLLVLERAERPSRPLPPFFIPVGTKDPLLDDTRRLDAALRALGADSEARYYPGELHAFHAMVFREAARRCWADTYAFLDRHVPRNEVSR